MSQAVAFANFLANLPLWARISICLVLLAFLVVSLGYVWGLRPRAIKKVVQADIPKSRDPREWLVWVAKLGWKGKAVATVLSLAVVAALVLPLMFANVAAIANVLGRNQARVVSPHLFVQHYQNYNHLFLEEDSERHFPQVEDRLEFQNVSNGPLTHFRILTFLYTDFAKPADFYEFYSIDTGTQYIALGVFDVGSLKSEESYTLKLKDVYARLVERTNVSASELNALLFPRVGEPLLCDYKKRREAPHQAYSKKTSLKANVFTPNPKFGGKELDGICGFPLKLIVNYRSGTSQVSNVFVGGTFYYGRLTGNSIIPHAMTVASFVKPRFSLVREKSGAEDEVVNMDLEISGRNYIRIPYRPDPDIVAWYTVVEPEGDDQLDQQLALTFDNGIEARLTSQAQTMLQAGRVEDARQTLDRLLTLSPGYEPGRKLRAQISATETATQ